jgi:serine/threonine protein phosphatase Stp1
MTMAISLRFEQGVRSDVGCVRQVNEDSWAARPRDGLWLVADGMGGHAHGQWASSTIAATLEAAPLPEDFEDAATVVRSALQAANANYMPPPRRVAQRSGRPWRCCWRGTRGRR